MHSYEGRRHRYAPHRLQDARPAVPAANFLLKRRCAGDCARHPRPSLAGPPKLRLLHGLERCQSDFTHSQFDFTTSLFQPPNSISHRVASQLGFTSWHSRFSHCRSGCTYACLNPTYSAVHPTLLQFYRTLAGSTSTIWRSERMIRHSWHPSQQMRPTRPYLVLPHPRFTLRAQIRALRHPDLNSPQQRSILLRAASGSLATGPAVPSPHP